MYFNPEIGVSDTPFFLNPPPSPSFYSKERKMNRKRRDYGNARDWVAGVFWWMVYVYLL